MYSKIKWQVLYSIFPTPRLGYEWWEPAVLQCGGDMWQGLGATCPLTTPCLSGFPRAVSKPGSQHSSCPALPPRELWDHVPSPWCPCPGRCAMTHSYWLTSLRGPLAHPAPSHMQLSRILAQIFSPTVIRCMWSCMIIHLWSSTETENCRACLIREVSSLNLKHTCKVRALWLQCISYTSVNPNTISVLYWK